MKKINLLLAILILTMASCAQEKKDDKPRIKSEEIIFYKIDQSRNRTTREGPGMDELVEYNADGKVAKVSVIEFDRAKDKNIYFLNERNFYEDKNLIKTEKLGYRTGEVYEETLCKYQQNKLLRKDIKSIENGKEVRKEDGSFYYEYTYQPNKEIEKAYEYDETEKAFVLAYIQHKIFDAKNNVIQQKQHDKNGEIYQQNDFSYNAENKLIKDVQTLRLPSTTTYKYNKEGDVTQSNYESEGTIVTNNYTYKYDLNGNWIEKKEVETTNAKRTIPAPAYLITRKIVYD